MKVFYAISNQGAQTARLLTFETEDNRIVHIRQVKSDGAPGLHTAQVIQGGRVYESAIPDDELGEIFAKLMGMRCPARQWESVKADTRPLVTEIANRLKA